MRFLIDRGIDLTTKDYRFNSNAHGWALYGLQDEKWRSGWRMRNGRGRREHTKEPAPATVKAS
jgi:hypothetical protein